MKTSQSAQSARGYITVALITIIVLFTTVTNGQKYRYSISYKPTTNRYLIGLETGMGTTTLNFKSDIDDLKDLKFYSTGWNMGLTAGDKAFKFRATLGNYSFKKSMSQTIDQKLLSVKINASPVKLFSKLKYFQAYVMTGVDYGVFSFTGMSVPEFQMPEPLTPPAEVCCCETGGFGPPSDPGMPGMEDNVEASDESPELIDSKTLSLKKAQLNAGLGADFTVAKKGRYFRMFAEAHYGIPFKEIINDLSLSNTKLSSQLVVNIGIGFGITR